MDILKVILKKNEEIRIKQGDPWVFSNEVASFEGKIKSGELCDVYSFNHEFIGRGFLNTASKIIVRIISYDKITVDEDFFIDRITKAYEYRKQLGFTNNCRVVFGEADLLPGLIVDKYGDYLSIQILCLGMDVNRELIKNALIKIFNPKGIMERSDVPIRLKEGLTEVKGFLYPTTFNPNVIIEENGIKLRVDLENGQKTGFFLDQKENRAAMHRICKGKEVLDCFTHTGSFALNAGIAGAKSVLGIDVSQHAIDCARRNAELNNLQDTVKFECHNAFNVLGDWSREGKQFDVVILDPPAFTKSRNTINSAIRGYKEINLRGLKMVKPGGYFATCSCSHYMSEEQLKKTVLEAAHDARRTLRQVEIRTQSADHPILWNSDESYYLKFFIFQVV